jgi:sugar transferase (PEP-CTERM/EpsH1 system associated)
LVVDVRRPILYLTHRLPFPPDKGDRIRTFHLLKWLAQQAPVHLACLADEPVPADSVAALSGLCERVEVVPLGPWSRWGRALASLATGSTVTEGAFRSPRLRQILKGWAGEVRYRAAIASASSVAPYLLDESFAEVPIVCDLMDVDSQKWLDYAAAGRGPKAWLYRTEGGRLRRLEQEIAQRSRAVTLVSEAETALFRRIGGGASAHAVTNGVDLDYFQPGPAGEGQGCVFVGALDYPPNIDGADWFCREIWPEIHRRYPKATIALVGRRPAPAVRRLAGLPGVELVGTVADVRPYLTAAAVAVVPLRIARGVQNKVLEAMAMGKAVVASPLALGALGVEPGVHVLAASTPADWADAVSRLFDDDALRSRLGAAGRRYVEDHHAWNHCLEPLARLLPPEESSLPCPEDCFASSH